MLVFKLAEQQDDSIGKLSDTIEQQSRDQQNEEQETRRQSITQRFKEPDYLNQNFWLVYKKHLQVLDQVYKTLFLNLYQLKTALNH